MPLKVPFHQQDTDTFCGPATAQMLSAHVLGTIINPQGALRDAIANAGKDPICTLGSSPTSLATALNQKLEQARSAVRFQAYSCASVEAATDLLMQTVEGSQRRPPTGGAALVGGGQHWIAVTGFEQGAAAPGVLVSLNDPFPGLPENLIKPAPPGKLPPPFVHTSHDGCGTGVPGGTPRGQPETVSLEGWKTTLIDATPKCPSGPSPKFIVVAADQLTERADVTRALARARSDKRNRFVEVRMVSELAAVAKLRRAIADYHVAHEIDQARVIAPTRIVKRLDLPSFFYYLIPLGWPDGTGLVGRIDAQTSAFLGAQRREQGTFSLAEPPEVRRLIGHELAEWDRGETALHVSDMLVWKPCRESASPYYPFWEVTDGQSTVAYIGLDGKIHRELQPER